MKILTCLGLSTAITWLELVSAMASLLSSKCGYVSQALDFIATESNGCNLVVFITCVNGMAFAINTKLELRDGKLMVSKVKVHQDVAGDIHGVTLGLLGHAGWNFSDIIPVHVNNSCCFSRVKCYKCHLNSLPSPRGA